MFEIAYHAGELRRIDGEAFDRERFSRWTLDYPIRRACSGVIRAWFAGTVAEGLGGVAVSNGRVVGTVQ